MYVVYLIMYIGKQVPWPYTSVCGLGVCGVSHHVHRQAGSLALHTLSADWMYVVYLIMYIGKQNTNGTQL